MKSIAVVVLFLALNGVASAQEQSAQAGNIDSAPAPREVGGPAMDVKKEIEKLPSKMDGRWHRSTGTSNTWIVKFDQQVRMIKGETSSGKIVWYSAYTPAQGACSTVGNGSDMTAKVLDQEMLAITSPKLGQCGEATFTLKKVSEGPKGPKFEAATFEIQGVSGYGVRITLAP